MIARCTVAALTTLAFTIGTARAADTDDSFREDGTLRSFSETYRESYRVGRSEPRYFRAFVENVTILGLGLGWYWYKRDINQRDWDYPNAAERFKNLEVSFDTNDTSTNHFNHPFGGSLFYGTARLNGLGVAESFGYAALSALVYDFVLEWREKPSINDMVLTPVGGLAIGEFALHLGDYAHSAPGGGRTIHKVLSYPLGLLHKFHPAPRSIDTLPPDSLGYSSYFAHRFDLLAGVSAVSNNLSDSSALPSFTTRAEIISMPGFLRPGRFAASFVDGNFTEGRGRFAANFNNQWIVDLLFDVNLAGRYAQDIKQSGTAWMGALNTSLRYFNRDLLGRQDFYAMAHLIGPAFKLWAVSGAFTAKLEGTAHVDFAGVRALAYRPWVERFGADGTRTVLQQQNYDHMYGGSARARGTLAYGDLELVTEAFYGAYGSFDRWDRFQENVTKNVHVTEQILELRAAIGWKLPWVPVQIRVFGDHLGRKGEMAPITVKRWDRQFGLELGLRL